MSEFKRLYQGASTSYSFSKKSAYPGESEPIACREHQCLRVTVLTLYKGSSDHLCSKQSGQRYITLRETVVSLTLLGDAVKYFFLSDSWITGRVWEFGGLWNESAWHRLPYLQQQSLCIQENGETLRLYQVEEAVLMVEVVPKAATHSMIGQVVLKRLLSAEQVIERLCQEETIFNALSYSTGEVTPARSGDPAAEKSETSV